MLVRDWMTPRVVTVPPTTSVLNARRLLQLHGFRHLPVVVDGAVVGIISERDIRVSDTALSRSLASLESDLLTGRYRRVESVMSTPAVTVASTTTVAAAAQLMVDRAIGALPVVDEGRIVGIIGLSDCVRALLTAPATPAAAPVLDGGHVDVDAIIPPPLDRGDERPGRPGTRPIALVVLADPAARLRTRNDLAALGYRVNTCPGPSGGSYCPGVRAGHLPCSRVPSDTELVVLDAGSAALAPFYERWLPAAEIRIGLDHDLTHA